jgi:hypothetical protein
MPLIMYGQGAPDTATATTRKGRPLRLFVDAGWMFGIHGIQFFRDYKRYLAGPASTFDVPTSVRAGMATFISDNVATGFQVGYHRAVVRETYVYQPFGADTLTRARQTITQGIRSSTLPVLLTLDYHPRFRQFVTYVGAGLGVTVGSFVWDEALSTSQAVGARSGGIRYDDTHINIAAMARAGMSLGWDKALGEKTGGALHIEFSYTYAPVTGPLFSAVGASIGKPVASSYTLQMGGVGLHAGVSIYLQ